MCRKNHGFLSELDQDLEEEKNNPENQIKQKLGREIVANFTDARESRLFVLRISDSTRIPEPENRR